MELDQELIGLELPPIHQRATSSSSGCSRPGDDLRARLAGAWTVSRRQRVGVATRVTPAHCRCGTELSPDLLACPVCGALTHSDRLKHLAVEAEAIHADSPRTARDLWVQASCFTTMSALAERELARIVLLQLPRRAHAVIAPADRQTRFLLAHLERAVARFGHIRHARV